MKQLVWVGVTLSVAVLAMACLGLLRMAYVYGYQTFSLVIEGDPLGVLGIVGTLVILASVAGCTLLCVMIIQWNNRFQKAI